MKKIQPPSKAPDGTKWCGNCQQFVPMNNFNKDNKALDGLQTYDKECKKIIRAETVTKKKDKGVNYEGDKKCRSCKKIKPRNLFNIDWRNADYLNSICKDCDSNRLQVRKNNLIPINNPDLTGTKMCTRCKIEKQRSEFPKNKFQSDGLFSWCKPCSKENTQKHYKNNKDRYILKSLERARASTKEQKDKKRKDNALWKKNNKERVAAYSAQRRVRISINMTQRDYYMSAMRRKRIKNNPCHYCGEFKKTMHIDHYIPVGPKYNGTEYFWNLVNSCADCNLSKGETTGYEFLNKLNLSVE